MQTSQVRIILTTYNIFQRINQSGKRLDRFDLISAVTISSEFDLPVKFKKDINEKLKIKAFGKISPWVVIMLMALIKRTHFHVLPFTNLFTDLSSYMKGSVLSLLPELGAMDSERRADEVTRPSTSQAG